MNDLDWKPRDGRDPSRGSTHTTTVVEGPPPPAPVAEPRQPIGISDDGAAVRDLNAKLAREAHARNAAFEKARVEAAAAKARHEAEVAAIAARNATRAAEHAQQVAAAQAAQRAYQDAYQPKPKGATCTTRSFSSTLSETASTQAAASQALSARFAQARGGDASASISGGAPSCKQRNVLAIKPPPVGNCLSCITEKMAVGLYGYVPGQGYPAPKVEWQCTATAQITRRECGSKEGSRVSNQ